MSESTFLDWPTEQPNYADLDAAVHGEIARWNAVGMAAGMVRDGERKISVGGFANNEARYHMVENSLFLIGSISKIYCSTLVLILVEQGLLDLDKPVVEYLPDFTLSQADVRDAITLRKLLSHTSGFDGDRFTSYGRGDDAYDKAIAEFDSLIQWFKPGSFYSYNNAGFTLAGQVIQKVTGKTYETVLTEELIEPLGLTNTFIQPDDVLNRSLAAGHAVDYRTGVSLHTSRHLPRHVNPAGGVIQSIGDLLTFAQMHLNQGMVNGKRILSAENARLMQEPLIEADTYHRHYGIGWAIYDRPTGKSVGHGGSWGGHRANLILYPQQNFAFASLVNSNVGVTVNTHMEKWAIRHYLNIVNPAPDRIDLSPLELSGHTGTYLRHDSRMLVEQAGANLMLSITDVNEDTGVESEELRRYELEPLEATRFRICSPENKGATVDFRAVPDANGNDRDLIRISGRVAARTADVS